MLTAVRLWASSTTWLYAQLSPRFCHCCGPWSSGNQHHARSSFMYFPYGIYGLETSIPPAVTWKWSELYSWCCPCSSRNFWFILFWWEGQDCQIFCTFLQHKTSWETLDHVVWSVPKAVPCIWTSYLFVVKLCIIGENTVLCDQVLIESWWRIAYMSRSTTFPSYFRLYYTNQAGKKRANLWRRWTMKLWLLSAVITAAGEGVICIQLLAYLSDCQLHLCMEEKPASCYCCLCFDCLDSYSRVFP